MNTKDFYIDSHFICGIRSPDNIFDLPESIFECGDFLCFEAKIKAYNKTFTKQQKYHIWPWAWHNSSLTNEVFIYEIDNDRILYYTGETKEFFDARLVRKEETLRGCEIFDCKFKFPLMMDMSFTIRKGIT